MTVSAHKCGVQAFTRKAHVEGLKYLKEVYNAEISTVDQIIDEIKNA